MTKILQTVDGNTAAAPSPAIRPAPVVSTPSPPSAAGDGVVLAPIPGRILNIKVAVGDSVSAGQTVAIMEAMKMEDNIVSNINGTVREIAVQEGAELANGQLIMVIE